MENPTTATIERPARHVSQLLRYGARVLTSKGIESAALDAEVLLGQVLGLSREQILVAANASLDDAQSRTYERLLSRRGEREPTAYITGKREFWSLDFCVSPDVLIPRPETELLVEIALGLAGEAFYADPLRVIDLGTGSGAIAVALASELKNAEIIATDISAEALAVAQDNAARHGVASRIRFIQSDLFDALRPQQSVALVVSNPPYIRSAEIAGLAPEVSRWEPRQALDGGSDGLEYYRRIAAQAFGYLAPNGALAIEIGAGMGEAVAALCRLTAECARVTLHNDYTGIERVVVARKMARASSI